MGRNKEVPDDEILRRAREVFLAGGHDVPVRELAGAVGLSPATLYQRFGGKDELFLKALMPTPPSLETWPNVGDTDEGIEFLLRLADHIAAWLDEALPLVLRLVAHPNLSKVFLQGDHGALRDHLTAPVAARLETLRVSGRMRSDLSPTETADLLVSLAHDSVVASALSQGSHPRDPETLRRRVNQLWLGLRPAE
jgi:AcrR family transcriptional regulator